MQSYTPYSFSSPHGNADLDSPIPTFSETSSHDVSPYAHYAASNAMLIDSGNGSSYGDPLDAAYGPTAPFQDMSQAAFPSPAVAQYGSAHPTYAHSPPFDDTTGRRTSLDQIEADTLQSSGLSAFDGASTSGQHGGVSGYPIDARLMGSGGLPLRSLSYTAGDAYGAPSGSGMGAGRPALGRADTFAAPSAGAMHGFAPQADPFARLRNGSISITPSSAPPKSRSFAPSSSRFGASGDRMASSSAVPFAGFGRVAPPPLSPPLAASLPPASPYPSYNIANPVYDLYGSSYASDQPPSLAAPRQPSPEEVPSTFSQNPSGPSDAFDPQALGLPMPPARNGSLTSSHYSNIYSSSGFDLVGVLARVVNRKNPTIEIGAIDMSCSFVVVDAKRFDQPIVFCSETFSRLTGYSNEEIVGRNCRFLQAPGDQLVVQGEKRRYTDGNAAHHLRKHIIRNEETQVSLINYHKSGKPFINLVTCVPISWNGGSSEPDLIVGFQVDLVDQPAAILDKMQNGSYVVDYSRAFATVCRAPAPATNGNDLVGFDHFEDSVQHAAAQAATQAVVKAGAASAAVQQAKEQLRIDEPSEIVDLVSQSAGGVNGLPNETIRKQFYRLCVDQCDDFIHVVSLKGAMLYVSAAARQLLEYEPDELLGKPLASFCHPADIVSVQRELKEAGVSSNPVVNLLYRIRRKNSGFMWLAAQGRLHLEPGKGRKCVILTGRPCHVYHMSWRDLEVQGGMSGNATDEFFAKVCVDGIFLTATKAAEQVLGIDSVAQKLSGQSVGDLSPPGSDDAKRFMDALFEASRGSPSKVSHRLRGGKGVYVDVITRFYPGRDEDEHQQGVQDVQQTTVDGKSVVVIAQVSLLSTEVARNKRLEASASARPSSDRLSFVANSNPTTPAESHSAVAAATTACASSAGVAINAPLMAAVVPGTGPPGLTTFSAVPSTFKSLTSSTGASDNVFDELNVTRGTSWQFELHQMRLTNKKLREEREALEGIRKKKKLAAQAPPPAVGSKAAPAQRACANCGRTSSAEWRSGPTGPKTLCNACGLRWSKARSQAAAKDKKRREEEEKVAAIAAVTAAISHPSPTASEGQSRSGSRDTTTSAVGSGCDTELTAVSPVASSPYPCPPGSAQIPSHNDSPMPMYPMSGAYAMPPPQGYPQAHSRRPSLQHRSSSMHYPYPAGLIPQPYQTRPPSSSRQ